ncbi:hypothetical protein MIB92_16295 [Aestuariirhabdus sp. Z084]|uniref:CAF17-like 4Fe-4S cluster assembly/insertion protein YgfZ n=1 Tax=Aestuariirhabdus haliotis TaxID=2918751 RepID=UPI00201B3A12|nr:hypothetical protein [Aestuariirhabdus haliotis]MCL6417222.1 hypothetical protein [Aestuariirhabdus haliotis]MCL6421213.1 hypothetical protein [Aestuariirhabdus haliotis]
MNTEWQQFLQQQPASQAVTTDDSWFCDLTPWSVMSVQEGDASRFLQGQLTCDLDKLEAGTSSLGACCNAKGRMLSNFRILPVDQGYWLVMHQDLIAPHINDLNKYAVFFRSKLQDLGSSLVGIGLHGQQAADWLKKQGAPSIDSGNTSALLGGQLICLDSENHRYQLWLPTEQAKQQWVELSGHLPRATPDIWLLGDIQQGIAWISGDTREQYTPHQFNLQALGAISFRKGCYTGQEIVARMQHLGKSKNRLYRATSTSQPQQYPCPIVDKDNQSVGEIISGAQSGEHHELLILAKNDAVDAKTLLFEDNKVLSVTDLPYAITNREHLVE